MSKGNKGRQFIFFVLEGDMGGAGCGVVWCSWKLFGREIKISEAPLFGFPRACDVEFFFLTTSTIGRK